MKYQESLRNPLWLEKRKIILKRDRNKCTVCYSKINLCVHHTYYYNQKTEPWDYPNKSLLTLCGRCHYNHHLYNENVYIDKPKSIVKKIKQKKIVKKKRWDNPIKEIRKLRNWPEPKGIKKAS